MTVPWHTAITGCCPWDEELNPRRRERGLLPAVHQPRFQAPLLPADPGEESVGPPRSAFSLTEGSAEPSAASTRTVGIFLMGFIFSGKAALHQEKGSTSWSKMTLPCSFE